MPFLYLEKTVQFSSFTLKVNRFKIHVCNNVLKILYLFVGPDDQSKRLTSIINEDKVSKQLASNNFVAIKVEANSVPHQQFAEICILYHYHVNFKVYQKKFSYG